MMNIGERFMRQIGLDKLFCQQPETSANVPSLTLDQLVLVRIQVRQLLANPSSGVFLSLRVETVPDGSLTCRLLILPPYRAARTLTRGMADAYY